MDLPAPLLAHILTTAFPAAAAAAAASPTAEPLSDESFNILYHLTTTPATVLKLAPAPHDLRLLRNDTNLLRTSAHILTLLAPTPLPTPIPLLHDSSCTHSPSEFLLCTYLPGAPATPKSPVTPELAAVSNPDGFYGRPFGRRYGCWRSAFVGLMEAAVQDGEEMLLQLPYLQIRGVFAAHGAALDGYAGGPRLGVLDWGEGNVLVREDGEVGGVVGFDRAVWGDPEVGGREWEVGEGGEGARERRGLYEVYRCVMGVLGVHYYGVREEEEMGWRLRLREVLEELGGFAESR